MLRSLLAAVLLVSGTWLAAGEIGDAPKVAVLNLIDAINASKVYQAKIEGFKKERAEYDARVKGADEQIQKLTTQIEALPQGNDKLSQLQEELESAKAKREAYMRRKSAEFDRKQAVIIQDSYKSTVDRLAEFCKARGIKIVVQAASKDVLARDLMVMNLRIEAQTALYYDADQDITTAFIGFLNAQPDVAPAPGPAPAPAPANGVP